MTTLYLKKLFQQGIYTMPAHSTINASDAAMLSTQKYLYPYAGTCDVTVGYSNGDVAGAGYYKDGTSWWLNGASSAFPRYFAGVTR